VTYAESEELIVFLVHAYWFGVFLSISKSQAMLLAPLFLPKRGDGGELR